MKRPIPLFLLLGLLSLGGCAFESEDRSAQAAAPAQDPVAFPYVQLAPSAPPAPMYEEAPVNYDPIKQVWQSGFWAYDGFNFEWVYGRFIERPSPTAVWAPARWEEHKFGWALIPGHWK